MSERRPGFARITLITAAGVSCLAVAACSSTPADPLVNVSASKVNAEVTTDAEVAPTVTMQGTLTDSGSTYNLDLGFKHGQGCEGTISIAGKGTFKLIVIGKTMYLKADNQFWNASAGAEASTITAVLNGRYLELPVSTAGVSDVSNFCNLSQELKQNNTPETYTKEAVTTLNGTRVLPIKVSDGTTEYVTDTSTPQMVKISAPKGSKNGYGELNVSVDAPVTLTAPPASQVLNSSALGG